MDEFPATLHAFAATFPDEAACWAWLRKRRWPGGFRCPRCAGRASYWLAERRLAQCVRCRHQASVTAGTVLHKLRAALGPDPSRLLRGRIEADESHLFAPHEKGRGGGRAAGRKTLVAAVVERNTNAPLRLGVMRSHTLSTTLGPSCAAPSSRAG